MANRVVMPKAGMAMETGTVVKWLKEIGDTIVQGEMLLEIETDKVNMEVEALHSGVLLAKFAGPGDVIPVVETIGYIGEAGEKIPAYEKTATTPEVIEKEKAQVNKVESKDTPVVLAGRVLATPAARRIGKEKGIDLASISPEQGRFYLNAQDVENAKVGAKASPLAKVIAADKGIDLDDITGSGFDGKVMKADLMMKSDAMTMAVQAQDVLVPLSGMRKVIARRMLSSHTEIPPVTQNTMVDVTKLLAFRKQLNESIDVKVTINDFVLAAVAKTLREQPNINSVFTDDGILQKGNVNVGFAVALEDGLIVPVIKDTDRLSIKGIALSAKRLATKARAGKLMPDEYSGGTFTISNVGMLGVTAFTPIINQPESAILGVCAIEQKLEMDDDGNIIRKDKMPLCLTYDHRGIDGSQAAIFSNRIVQLLQNPLSFFV